MKSEKRKITGKVILSGLARHRYITSVFFLKDPRNDCVNNHGEMASESLILIYQ